MAAWPERFSHAIIIGLAALLVAAVIALVVERRDNGRPLTITAGTPTASGPMMAYITGAVAQPGVYQVADGDRVIDLLNKAGGAAADANLAAVNLAQRLHDEDRVIVPRAGEAASATTPISQVAGTTTTGWPININTASAQDLDSLPGIGQVYSQRIVDSRTNAGPFTTTDDLVTRQLLPRATYDKIRDLITVGP